MLNESASLEPSSPFLTTNDGEDTALDATRARASRIISPHSLRTRQNKRTKLLYDQKYHPMDDIIRPSQAAKRRRAHGDIMSSPEDESDWSSVYADNNFASPTESKHEEKKTKSKSNQRHSKQVNKRSRSQARSMEPARSSKRKTLNRNACYNMDTHPQDADLERLSSDEQDSDEAQSLTTGTNDHRESPQPMAYPSHQSESTSQTEWMSFNPQVDIDPNPPDLSEFSSSMDCNILERALRNEPDIGNQPSSLASSITTTMPPDNPHQQLLDACEQSTYEYPHNGDRDFWGPLPGLPFDIYTERLEDQRLIDMNGTLPLNFEHDDKENDPDNLEIAQPLNTVESMHVMPASQYQQTSESVQVSRHLSLVHNAFYDNFQSNMLPYGLGGHDGAHDEVIAKAIAP